MESFYKYSLVIYVKFLKIIMNEMYDITLTLNQVCNIYQRMRNGRVATAVIPPSDAAEI